MSNVTPIDIAAFRIWLDAYLEANWLRLWREAVKASLSPTKPL